MMKRVFVLISLVVAILVIVGNAFAQDKTPKPPIPEPSLSPEWKLIAIGSYGSTLYVNTRKITYLPGGIVKVRTLWVQRGETRRTLVNALKKILLLKGEDPNEAESYWYNIDLDEVNCKTHQIALMKITAYSFGKAVLFSYSFQHEKWDDIVPGSLRGGLEKYVCKEAPPSIPAQYKQTIPEPSLGPEWKPLFRAYNGSTYYVDPRWITHLPKGIVKVWILLVPREEFRRGLVNVLKQDLTSKGKDPNNAERLWYVKFLDKVNCKTHQYATLEWVAYSFEKTLLDDISFQYEEWKDIVPGSEGEVEEKYVCK